MKLHDALRNDTELREDLAGMFAAEREQCLQRIEQAATTDTATLQAERLYLDALHKLRFTFFREELNRGRRQS